MLTLRPVGESEGVEAGGRNSNQQAGRNNGRDAQDWGKCPRTGSDGGGKGDGRLPQPWVAPPCRTTEEGMWGKERGADSLSPRGGLR